MNESGRHRHQSDNRKVNSGNSKNLYVYKMLNVDTEASAHRWNTRNTHKFLYSREHWTHRKIILFVENVSLRLVFSHLMWSILPRQTQNQNINIHCFMWHGRHLCICVYVLFHFFFFFFFYLGALKATRVRLCCEFTICFCYLFVVSFHFCFPRKSKITSRYYLRCIHWRDGLLLEIITDHFRLCRVLFAFVKTCQDMHALNSFLRLYFSFCIQFMYFCKFSFLLLLNCWMRSSVRSVIYTADHFSDMYITPFRRPNCFTEKKSKNNENTIHNSKMYYINVSLSL